MPLPTSHIKALKRDLEAHDERLAFLRNQIAHFSEEARFHQNVLELGRDPRIMKALDELCGSPQLMDELARDKAGYAKRREIALPQGTELDVEGRQGGSRVLLRFKHGGWAYSCFWDSEHGFRVEPAAAVNGTDPESR